MIPIIMYHYIRPRTVPPYTSCPAETLDAQIRYLKERFPIITFRDLAEGKRGCILTFDDGLKDHYYNAFPILKKHGVKGVFYTSGETLVFPNDILPVHLKQFLIARLGAEHIIKMLKDIAPQLEIPADYKLNERYIYDNIPVANLKHIFAYMPERELLHTLTLLKKECVVEVSQFQKSLYLNEREVSEMSAAGMEFGVHGYSHRILDKLSLPEMEMEIRESKSIVERITGVQPVSYAYPYGGYNSYTIGLLKRYGFEYAVTTNYGINGEDDLMHPYELKRIDTNEVMKELP